MWVESPPYLDFQVVPTAAYLFQTTDTHGNWRVCRRGLGAVGVRLQLEKNVWRTSASLGGGILDEKNSFIEAPYSIVWDWGIGMREARRKPGFLEKEHRLWKI